MSRIALIAGALVCVLASQAQAADLLDSPECHAARERLDVAEAAAVRGLVDKAALGKARERTALACFGRPPDQPQGERAPQPVRAVPPITGPVPPMPPRPATPPGAEPLPPVVVPRAPVITTCDPAGCWDSNGNRLNRVGPDLIGPRGPCTVQGNLANCP